MKRIRKSRISRILTWLLTVAMITPTVLGIIAPATANAQALAAGAGGVQTVVVLDFLNKSGVGGDALARLATDEVAVALANSARFEVLKRDEVIRTANELGLRPPYDQVAKSKLAAQLGASSIVEGSIEFVREVAKSNPRTITAGLTVRISEALSGDLLSGAAQIGEARARAGQSDRESLTQEAVSNAAVLAVRQILGYTLPEGTVLSTVGSPPNVQVLINRGSRDGVQEGMELIVTRDRQRVGKILVTSVFPADSEAKITENTLGIRPEDKVRAVFPMPAFTRQGTIADRPVRRSNSSSISAVGKILLVLLVGVVIAMTAGGGTSTVTGVTAEADTQNGGPAVQLIWRDNLFGNGRQTLEYHVWRSPDDSFNYTGTPVAAVGNGVRQYTDFPAPFSFWDGAKGFLRPGFPAGGGTGGATGAAATTVTPAASAITGFKATGQQVTYQITAVIRRPRPQASTGGAPGGGGGGATAGSEDIESGVQTSGPSTPLDQPILTSPNDQAANVSPFKAATLTFAFSNPNGADTFQLEVSTDSSFKNPNLIKIVPVGIPSNSVGVTGILFDGKLQNDPGVKAFTSGASSVSPRLFWRVGVRRDSDRPGPKHWITRRHDDPDRTFRFIYSNPRSLTFAPMPPGPP